MKPSLFLPALLLAALLLAALPASLHAAPGTVLTVVEHIDQGDPNIPSLDDSGLFGRATASLGDLDGNGHEELAVGQPGNRAVHILFRGSGGLVTSSLTLRPAEGGLPPSVAPVGSRFGQALALLGDLDGDGLPELAVGAPGEDAVYVLFLNADGSVRQHVRIPSESGDMGTDFGASLAAVGDLDGNGASELVVGAPLDDTGGVDCGAVHTLFLGADGSLLAAPVKNANDSAINGTLLAGDQFGSSCALIGDIDLDGLPEIAVGARFDDTGGSNRGALHTFSLDANGSVTISQKFAHGAGTLTLGNGDLFGSSVTSLGDIDGNGMPDLAVGATDEGPGNLGAVHILFLTPEGTLGGTSKIGDGVGGFPFATLGDQNENFGFSLALLGSSSVNHLPLLAVGTPGDEGGGNDKGAVYLLELGNPPILVTTLEDEFDTPATNGTGVSLREAARDADATGEFRTIRFAPSLNGGIISLDTTTRGSIQVNESVRITGEGLASGLTLTVQNADRMFLLAAGGILKLDSLNVSEARTAATGGGSAFLAFAPSRLVLDRVTFAGCGSINFPGGVVTTDGSLLISNCTFTENSAPGGGAVHLRSSGATLAVLNSTFANNSSTDPASGGGAILCASLTTLTIRHCTFAGNEAMNTGGAIRSDTSAAISFSSLYSGNLAGSGDNDTFGVVFTLGDGQDNASVPIAELMPLADYGGPTQTRPLKPASTAKGTVSYRALPAFDQRGAGFPRTVGTGRDPGAVEGLESRDFQPDSRIGLTAAGQVGNNVYNTSGQGQTVKLTLSGRKKTSSFFTAENDGVIRDALQLRSVAPKKKTLKGSVFRLTGGRTNVSAQVFGTGLALGDLNPGATVAFQADWSRKSATLKARQTIQITTSSSIALKSDVVGAKIGSK